MSSTIHDDSAVTTHCANLKGKPLNFTRLLAHLVFAVIALSLLASLLSAQVSTADIVGTVTDSSGAVISGVKVTATNLNTGLPYTTVSNASGDFIISQLQTGHYKITAEATGFNYGQYRTSRWLLATDSGQTHTLRSALANRALK
jgi:hypothetical protein